MTTKVVAERSDALTAECVVGLLHTVLAGFGIEKRRG